MEATRQLKANLKLKGEPCSACQAPFELGDDVSVCQQCQANHHTACWDGNGGCSTSGCVNAPLQKLEADEAPQAQNVPPGFKRCHSCSIKISETEDLCPYCDAIVSPDGIYRGPKENAPGAVASLVYGIVGLFVCGLIFGIVAISKSRQASEAIADNPRYQGDGLATAGMVLGIIDLVLWALIILMRIGGA